MAPSVRRVEVVRYRIYVAGLPAFGGSVVEIGSSPTGTADAPIPDQERARIRSYLRRFDKRLDKQAVEGEAFLENPDWRPPPRWYCTPCGQLRSYEDRFCRLCGNARPADEPKGVSRPAPSR